MNVLTGIIGDDFLTLLSVSRDFFGQKDVCTVEMVSAAEKFVADKSWRVRYAVAK